MNDTDKADFDPSNNCSRVPVDSVREKDSGKPAPEHKCGFAE